MDNLYIPATKHSPEIDFDYQKNTLLLSGQSYPENTAVFYQPIINWIKDYIDQIDDQETVFNISIVYFNSSSSKVFMDILDLLDNKAKEGGSFIINWHYDKEDEIILEHGEEFKEDLEHLSFNLLVK
ncbi:MAG: DUF1987 domain-containing protein [Deltaproteobacteria bacterium]|jgi:hypothetical protein|nr:DUF1987 domain-containing protein [Deltaproteobacteria bacterium]